MRPRVLFVSGREPEYIRNRVLIDALARHFDLCVLTPSTGSILSRTARSIARLVASKIEYDMSFVGFYGQPLAVALSRLQRKPIILDAYVSTFDTLCEDRQWFRPRSAVGRVSRWIDSTSCQVASCVLTDTDAQARYFTARFGVPSTKLKTIYVGCDESIFYERSAVSESAGGIEVFYYGAFLPLHGTEIIVRAADLLRHLPYVHFTIGGSGPRYQAVRALVTELGLQNVELPGWIPIEQIPGYVTRASICLGGHFSTVPKAARVISTKTFQFIAMGKATIVGDNPATRELFTPEMNVCSVQMGSASELARAIARLARDAALRERLGSGGRELFRRRLGTDLIADELACVVRQVLANHSVGTVGRASYGTGASTKSDRAQAADDTSAS